ncbi:MAG: hypothetical protein ACI9K2_003724 [Myxococcota bacterium]|jgi:hypothetical protein
MRVVPLLVLALACADGDKSNPPSVEADLEVTRELIGFGEVALGESEIVFLSVRNNTDGEVRLTADIAGPDAFSVTSPELPTTIPGNDGVTLTVQYMPSEAGEFEATMSVSTVRSAIPVRLTGVARAGEVEAVPIAVALEFSVGMDRETGAMPITIRNNGDGELVVRSITVPEGLPYFVLAEAFEPFSLSGATAADVRVAYEIPLDLPAEFGGQLLIETNDPVTPSLVVPLSASVLAGSTTLTTPVETGDTSDPPTDSETDSGHTGDTGALGETGDTGPGDSGL